MQQRCDNWLLAAVLFPLFPLPDPLLTGPRQKGWNKKAALTCHLHFMTLLMLLVNHLLLPCSAELVRGQGLQHRGRLAFGVCRTPSIGDPLHYSGKPKIQK